ncbi:MAG: hypothetical protein IT285_11880, partial [Bdellovibrionales bacterium]|nr:hypothetical protein [Bdellovibrionales bacterium]
NLPTQGYYKVRTPTGEVGWVAGENLALYGGGFSGGEGEMPAPADPAPRPFMAAENTEKRGRKAFRLRAFGGLTLFNMADFGEVTGFNELSNGPYFGGELHFLLTRKVSMDVRIEAIVKSTVGRDDKNKRVYQFDVFSLPVMIGVGAELASSRKAEFHISALGGIALNTEVSATASSLAEPNETILQSIPFVGMFKADFGLRLGGNLYLSVEAGYRDLTTKKLEPSTSGNGSDLFENTADEVVPVTIDLSGFFFGTGVSFSF